MGLPWGSLLCPRREPMPLLAPEVPERPVPCSFWTLILEPHLPHSLWAYLCHLLLSFLALMAIRCFRCGHLLVLSLSPCRHDVPTTAPTQDQGQGPHTHAASDLQTTWAVVALAQWQRADLVQTPSHTDIVGSASVIAANFGLPNPPCKVGAPAVPIFRWGDQATPCLG